METIFTTLHSSVFKLSFSRRFPPHMTFWYWTTRLNLQELLDYPKFYSWERRSICYSQYNDIKWSWIQSKWKCQSGINSCACSKERRGYKSVPSLFFCKRIWNNCIYVLQRIPLDQPLMSNDQRADVVQSFKRKYFHTRFINLLSHRYLNQIKMSSYARILTISCDVRKRPVSLPCFLEWSSKKRGRHYIIGLLTNECLEILHNFTDVLVI